MQITLETSKGTAYYYTRVVSRSGLNVDQYVKFVKSFYEKSMDKASAEDLTSYLEPVDTGASANYNDVNINSTFNQISWGSLSPQIYKKGIPLIGAVLAKAESSLNLSNDYYVTYSFSYVLLRLKGYTNPGQAAPGMDTTISTRQLTTPRPHGFTVQAESTVPCLESESVPVTHRLRQWYLNMHS